MAELIPARFVDLVARLHHEPASCGTLFGLNRRHWHVPDAEGPELTVQFHGQPAGNPVGPAAGPHTQMAQNILICYVAGARILELKTVQVNDRLTIPRPCIDIATVGFNVEWSQELRIQDSLREYVAGAMLIHMFRNGPWLPDRPLAGPRGDAILDVSVGYDLAGVRSSKVRGFLEGMRDASAWVTRLRGEIPRALPGAGNLDYPTQLATSVTVSTFHGCPADEVEGMCELLIADHDLDVVVKMNPTLLGREHLEHLLFDVMGYTELAVNADAYDSSIRFDEAVEMCRRLTGFASARGRRLGFKFTNTLEVVNHRDFFPSDNKVMYLSGQPLHVIALTLADKFRQAAGPHVPITFSAGIDRFNFPDAVACGFVPVTVSTDLLRPGGYGRLPPYLRQLSREMRRAGAADLDAFILNTFGKADEARRRADDEAHGPDADERAVRWAGWLNTSVAAQRARQEPRYRAEKNRKPPQRMDSRLETFDCITCDKCIPVCPNAANFTYPTPVVSFEYRDVLIDPSGATRLGAVRRFAIEEESQIACYADFCNECGNCDTFCPEYGGPYIQKPSFYGSDASYRRAAPRDGFLVRGREGGGDIRGRIRGREYVLSYDEARREYHYIDGTAQAAFSADNHELLRAALLDPAKAEHRLDMGIYHTLRFLRDGMRDPRLSDWALHICPSQSPPSGPA